MVWDRSRQTTAETGPDVTAEESRERYAVNGLGLVSNLVFPKQRVSLGVKFFEEFPNRAGIKATHCRYRALSRSEERQTARETPWI